MFDLSGKVAIVTGSSRGIGEAIALAYSEFGAKLVLASRKLEGLNTVREKIESSGGEAICIPTHMGDPTSIENLVAETMKYFGTIDILVNNAATNPFFGPTIEASESVWDKIIDVNLKGAFLLTKAVGKIMIEKNEGCIINICSEAAIRPMPGLGVYSISKAGLDMITKVFAQELGQYGIRVNGIAPGLAQTKFSKALWGNEEIKKMVVSRLPLGRIAQPHEIAGTAVFLASRASSFITGHTIVADGGSLVS